MRKLVAALVVMVIFAGCSSVQMNPLESPLALSPVAPDSSQEIDVEQAIVIVDASRSMLNNEKFITGKSLAQSFVAGMPQGDYQSGLIVFGGDESNIYSLKPFNRSGLAAFTDGLEYMSGITPLEDNINDAAAMLDGTSGKTAIIVFSDGLPTYTTGALKAAKNLVESHNGDVCIHAVQVGQSVYGAEFLQQLVNLSSCGSFRNGVDVSQVSAMEDFLAEVFFGEKEIVVEPKEEPDTDGDGVVDSKDECPGTPKGAKVDKRGCWVIPGVTFELDKAVIRPQFYPSLNDVAVVLEKNSGVNIRLDGHTCDLGTEKHNDGLSLRRSKAVREYLVEKGVDAERLTVRGFGESQPIVPNTSEANRSQNRRVELTVVE